MDDIRLLIKRRSPASVALQVIRSAITMHPVAARAIINEFTLPLKEQKRFIRKFDNEHWKGSLIMSEMIRCDDETAIKRLKKSDVIIFEIHGGGFRVGNSTMYMDSFINWLRLFKQKHNMYACIMSVEYGLTPEHKYPGPLFECMAAYKYLTKDLGVSPNKIVFSGDSAGAALCFETLIRTYAPEIINDLNAPRTNFSIPLPAAILFTSPLLSSDTTHDSWTKYEKEDIITYKLADMVFKEYLGLPETKIEDLPILRLSQITSGFDRFLPKHVLLIVGTREVLRDSAMEMYEALKKENADVKLVEENFPHDWFLVHSVIDNRKRDVVKQYDEMFVDFAVKSVKEARKQEKRDKQAEILKKETPTNEEDNEDVDVVQELIESDIMQSLDKVPSLEIADFPKPVVHRPNTILSEYTVIRDDAAATFV
ncbi:Alpha/Beta hydrolase protein [Sporodiniella umbellata]|nr:Alpha/Beta hydrolase protein [Sporodiniella umbellata]